MVSLQKSYTDVKNDGRCLVIREQVWDYMSYKLKITKTRAVIEEKWPLKNRIYCNRIIILEKKLAWQPVRNLYIAYQLLFQLHGGANTNRSRL